MKICGANLNMHKKLGFFLKRKYNVEETFFTYVFFREN